MAATLRIAGGHRIIIDDCDLAAVSAFHWCARVSLSGKIYAVRKFTGTTGSINLARWLLNPPANLHVDHVNRDTLDNRRSNLRIATITQNNCNREYPAGKTGYRGVTIRPNGKFNARIRINGRNFSSIHDTLIEAVCAYDLLSQKHHGEFGITNLRHDKMAVGAGVGVAPLRSEAGAVGGSAGSAAGGGAPAVRVNGRS